MTAMQQIFKQQFLINPAMAAPMWAPASWQMRRFVNPNYGNSLWLGAWSLVAAPVRCLAAARGFLEGHLWMTLYMMLIGVWAVALRQAWWGLNGRARAVNLPIEVLLRSQTMDEGQAARTMNAGNYNLVRQVRG